MIDDINDSNYNLWSDDEPEQSNPISPSKVEDSESSRRFEKRTLESIMEIDEEEEEEEEKPKKIEEICHRPNKRKVTDRESLEECDDDNIKILGYQVRVSSFAHIFFFYI